MKLDLMYWLVALFLFCSGAVFGAFIPSEDFWELGLLGYFEVAASLATVAGVFVAIPALNTWRVQFKHTERHNRVGGLYGIEKSFIELYRLADAVSDYGFKRMREEAVEAAVLEIDNVRRQYFQESYEYEKAWRNASLYMSKAERESFNWSPKKLENFYMSTVVSLQRKAMEKMTSENVLEFHEECSKCKQELGSALNEVREEIDKLIVNAL
nr:hypothetical protein [uncultured Pseudomonas sp.]